MPTSALVALVTHLSITPIGYLIDMGPKEGIIFEKPHTPTATHIHKHLSSTYG